MLNLSIWVRISKTGITMTKNIGNQIQSELTKLEALIGVWETKGWTRESSSAPTAEITAPDTYEWLANGLVLLHRVDARVGSEKVDGAQIIGYYPSQPTYQTQYFGSDGPNAYEAKMIEEAGGLTWKMQSKKDRFTGVFSENRDVITGHWELLDEDGRWQPWMDVTLTKVKN
jgi:hypothetical protein